MVKVVINGNTFNAARGAAKRRENIEYRDQDTPGLMLRVRDGACQWFWAKRDGKVSLCRLGTIENDELEKLRTLVKRLKIEVAEDRDPKILVKSFIDAGGEDIQKAVDKAGVAAGEWIWETMRDRYLEYSKETHSKATYNGYRKAIGAYEKGILAGDFKCLCGMPIKSITPSDISGVLLSIQQRGKSKGKGANWNQMRLTHATIRSCFAWATSPEVYKNSQLTLNISLMVPVPKRPKKDATDARGKATFTAILASPLELHNFAFKWIVTDYECHPSIVNAIRLQLLTGQRIETVVSAHKSEFVRTPGRPWRYAWALGPDKQGAYRLLPLPDVASYTVHEMLTDEEFVVEENIHLFPPLRPDKGKTTDRAKGHLSYSAIKNAVVAARKEGGPLPSTFKGTHDHRRAFTTHLDDWKSLGFVDGKSVETVTHKNEGRESVSQSIYNYDEKLKEKFQVLQTYEDKILYAPTDGVRDEFHDKYWSLTPEHLRPYF
jgi:integrase